VPKHFRPYVPLKFSNCISLVCNGELVSCSRDVLRDVLCVVTDGVAVTYIG